MEVCERVDSQMSDFRSGKGLGIYGRNYGTDANFGSNGWKYCFIFILLQFGEIAEFENLSLLREVGVIQEYFESFEFLDLKLIFFFTKNVYI